MKTNKLKLRQLANELEVGNASVWAWDNLKHVISHLLAEFETPSILEIGGGRSPFFSHDEVIGLGISYTVNDISKEELDRLPQCYNTLCADIQAPDCDAIVRECHYDVIFSRMVFEHLRDAPEAYSNVYRLLKPGGVVVNFFPTLFCLPFTINWLLPEWLTAPILRAMFPQRNPEEIPKFPAYYSYCYSSEKRFEKLFKDIGYSEYVIFPFYGHDYYRKIPGVRNMGRAVTNLAQRYDWRLLTAYAFLIASR